eukprot:TRINITY_DN9654_c0_g1_i1.p1 TRINITY_DN9654_c0_g1~~TRINITY_DN9654_c0_g1_i1.p1  ORF type:complete len:113 (+),score=5.49 TRINITY_DN9654_c0_g1_i1:1976-2314(+)
MISHHQSHVSAVLGQPHEFRSTFPSILGQIRGVRWTGLPRPGTAWYAGLRTAAQPDILTGSTAQPIPGTSRARPGGHGPWHVWARPGGPVNGIWALEYGRMGFWESSFPISY